MSASFDIQSSSGSYSVHVENHSFDRCMHELGESLIIADAFFKDRFRMTRSPAIYVEASEALKSLEAAPALIEQIRKAGAVRKSHLVSVGGGILQDISAFIASIYMRGLEWSYFPTTVLAMVDSCIGGKSSINVGQYKNLVGTFHPPVRINIDPSLATTLPSHERASGLVEAAKICFCRGAETFQRYLSYTPGVAMSVDTLQKVIVESLLAKKWFIEVDEFDQNERLLLNFGHTFGHAIEGASKYSISHGLAVGLGIVCALDFVRQSGTDYSRAPAVSLLEQHLRDLLRTAPDLSDHLRSINQNDFMQRFESDKKHTRNEYTLILASEAGDVGLQRIPRTEDSRARISRAVAHVVDTCAC